VVFCVALLALRVGPIDEGNAAGAYAQEKYNTKEVPAAASLAHEACADAEQPGNDTADTHDKKDLCAQFQSAAAAEKSADFARWQTRIGVIGLAAVLLTLAFNIRATNAAAEAAEAAKKSADAFMRAERPHLLVNSVEMEGADFTVFGALDRSPVGALGRGGAPREPEIPFAVFDLSNYGKGVALFKTVVARMVIGPLPDEPDYSMATNAKDIIAPEKEHRLLAFLDDYKAISDAEIRAAGTDAGTLHAYMRLEYTDVFGGEHVNRCAYKYIAPNDFPESMGVKAMWVALEKPAYWEYR